MIKIVIKTAIIIIVIEVIARLLLPHDNWYGELERVTQNNAIKYIFIGSSRVAGSINPSVFTRSVGTGNIQNIAINMGKGDSTLIEHLFGIKKIADTSPNKLKGVVVFLEAPQGFIPIENWQNSWLNKNYPQLLAKTIRFKDMGAFWFRSGTDFKSKVIVTSYMLSAYPRLKGRWRSVVFRSNGFNSNTSELTNGILWRATEIRTDDQGIQNARRLAHTTTNDILSGQKLLADDFWDKSVLKSLNDLVISAGGSLVLFQMPISSIQMKVGLSTIGKRNSLMIYQTLYYNHIPVIVPNIITTDDDFPDLWHLRASRSNEYTQSIAQAYLHLKNKQDKDF